jgi:cysteinyl-tRNA synthetase
VRQIVPEDLVPDTAVADPHRAAFVAAMDDDLNAPAAVAALHELVSDGNDRLKKAAAGDEPEQQAVSALAGLLVTLADEVLGIGIDDWLGESAALEARISPLVQGLLDARKQARADRDFGTADAIRDQLTAAGVVVEDGPDGARWYAAAPLPDPTPDA